MKRKKYTIYRDNNNKNLPIVKDKVARRRRIDSGGILRWEHAVGTAAGPLPLAPRPRMEWLGGGVEEGQLRRRGHVQEHLDLVRAANGDHGMRRSGQEIGRGHHLAGGIHKVDGPVG